MQGLKAVRSFFSLILSVLFTIQIGIFFLECFSVAPSMLKIYLLIFSSLIVAGLMWIGYVKILPVYVKTRRVAELNRIVYDLLKKSVYLSDKEQFYQEILISAIKSIDASTKGSIMIMDKDTGCLKFVAAEGYDLEVLRNTYLLMEQTYLYRESNGNVEKTVAIHDPFEYDRVKFRDENIDEIMKAGTDEVMSTLSTPIFYQGELYGMMNVDSPKINAYDQYDVDVIELFAVEIANVLKMFFSLEELNYITQYDVLTKVYNRKQMNDELNQIQSDYEFTKKPYCIVSIDLNDLKKTNDTFGHDAGDLLLIQFAEFFSKNLPKKAIFGRYGGDEFLLILPGSTKKENELTLLNISQKFEKEPFVYQDHVMPITFCYGIACSETDSTDIGELVKISDKRMYISKRKYHQS